MMVPKEDVTLTIKCQMIFNSLKNKQYGEMIKNTFISKEYTQCTKIYDEDNSKI